jgi:hypothetical protein
MSAAKGGGRLSPKEMRKAGNPLLGLGFKEGKWTTRLNDWGWKIAPGADRVFSGIYSKLVHADTKKVTRSLYNQMKTVDKDNAKWQGLLAQGQDESLSGVDTWDVGDDKAAAPIDLMTRSAGVLRQFGPAWANLDPKLREDAVRLLVDNDLINSKYGNYEITDPEAAQTLVDTMLKGANGEPLEDPANPSASPAGDSAFDASGKRLRDWRPGDKVYGGLLGGK